MHRPAGGITVEERVPHGGVGAELEQDIDRRFPAGLGGEMQGWDPFAVARPAETVEHMVRGTMYAPMRRTPLLRNRSAASI